MGGVKLLTMRQSELPRAIDFVLPTLEGRTERFTVDPGDLVEVRTQACVGGISQSQFDRLRSVVARAFPSVDATHLACDVVE